ncbi:hypothetical protein KSP39_PZI019630 [Platanthera zijinensis]|uniref:Uncharacterized protein n=1 Tax=Platanthera zijinensis TaxID=2320716 RepID=A0AAP0B257_9ASPA
MLELLRCIFMRLLEIRSTGKLSSLHKRMSLSMQLAVEITPHVAVNAVGVTYINLVSEGGSHQFPNWHPSSILWHLLIMEDHDSSPEDSVDSTSLSPERRQYIEYCRDEDNATDDNIESDMCDAAGAEHMSTVRDNIAEEIYCIAANTAAKLNKTPEEDNLLNWERVAQEKIVCSQAATCC